MADDFHDLDDFFEGFGTFPQTASPFNAPQFHRLGGPFAPPPDIGFGNFCPRRSLGGSHPIFGFAAAASSTLSSLGSTAARLGSGWPLHRSAPWPPRHPSLVNPPGPQPELPRLPTLRDINDIASRSASRSSPSRVNRGLSAFHRRATPARREPNSDDYYLDELATGNFSSPSIIHESPRPPNTAADSARESSPWPTTGSSSNNSGQASGTEVKRESEGEDSGMPGARRGGRRPAASGESSRSTKKRNYDDMIKSEDDPFTEKAPEDSEVVDLSATEKVPDSLTEPKRPKNDLKLSKFQCVICMDDTTALTITHCGHLFCGECLHSSLHIDSSKKICPICRQKVEARPSSGKFSLKAKGYYPLQLRVLTKKSLGKRAAQ